MPFESKAQRRRFYADPRLRKYAAEWEGATKHPLPERKRTGGHHKKAVRKALEKQMR